VNVEVDDLPRVLKVETETIAAGGKKSEARTLVQASLRQNPQSPAAPAAKKFLQSLR
jgi:hypothetical protein